MLQPLSKLNLTGSMVQPGAFVRYGRSLAAMTRLRGGPEAYSPECKV